MAIRESTILPPRISRRNLLCGSVGLSGLALPTLLSLRADAASLPRAKSCIVIYLWGGIAHQESWDPKPEALSELRGEFQPISTATPGVHFCEHIPLMARHSEKLAVCLLYTSDAADDTRCVDLGGRGII